MFQVKDILDSLGEEKIYQIGFESQNRYLDGDRNGRSTKFFVREKLAVAHFLGLHNSEKKELLDIGTGAGWFPYICKLYGHSCTGTDFLGRPEYDPVYEFLGIDVKEILVEPFKPLPLTQQYDYITSMRAFFPQKPKAWDKEEYKFFFNDIAQYLKPSGSLYLGSNSGGKLDKRFKHMAPEEKSFWGAKELADWFEPFLVKEDKVTEFKGLRWFTLHIPKEKLLELANN